MHKVCLYGSITPALWSGTVKLPFRILRGARHDNQKHYPDLGSEFSSVLKFSAVGFQRSFREETGVDVAKCLLFFRLRITWFFKDITHCLKVALTGGLGKTFIVQTERFQSPTN